MGPQTPTGKKEKLIQESIKLFVRKSYKGTSIQNITDRAGVSKATFYWHFKSKEDLLQAILEAFERNLIDWVIKQVETNDDDFMSRYKGFHKLSTEFAYRNRDLCVVFMTLSAEFSGSRTAPERRIKAIYDKYRAFLRELIDQGKREGHVRQDLDSLMAAHLLNAVNNGNLLEWYMNYSDIDGGLLAKTYREVTLRGILTEEHK